jgi:hypothetical protein
MGHIITRAPRKAVPRDRGGIAGTSFQFDQAIEKKEGIHAHSTRSWPFPAPIPQQRLPPAR